MFFSKIGGSLRKYYWVGLLSAKSNIAYVPEVLGRLIFLTVILYIFLRLWQLTYSQLGTTELGGLTIRQMLWYLTMTEAMLMSGPRVSQLVDEDVRTGSIVVQLIKPFSYPMYRLSTNIGERLVRFAVNFMAGAFVSYCFVGPLQIQWQIIPACVIAILLGFVIDFLCQFAIGIGAFWLEDTSGMLLIYSRLTMILGGVLMPVKVFPPVMQAISALLPFSSVYGAAKIFVSGDCQSTCQLLALQLATISVLTAGICLIYRAAMQRVAANGG